MGSRGKRRVTLLLLTYILLLQGSLYETSNLDRGGNNRKKKIEEFSRSSREKLVQSKNKMFSKFTSILQHAVEAVSFSSLRRMFVHRLVFVSRLFWLKGAFGRQDITYHNVSVKGYVAN